MEGQTAPSTIPGAREAAHRKWPTPRRDARAPTKDPLLDPVVTVSPEQKGLLRVQTPKPSGYSVVVAEGLCGVRAQWDMGASDAGRGDRFSPGRSREQEVREASRKSEAVGK